MDDLDDLQESEFVTDNEDQDSLDEHIDSEQRLRNQQLWASFQNAASCITKLYKDRAQPNISPWIPFQHAASNLTTLYKDCIESQKRFARIGYQVGRRKRLRDISKLLKKHKLSTKQLHVALSASLAVTNSTINDHKDPSISSGANNIEDIISSGQQNNVASILAVNQLNLGHDDQQPAHSMQAQPSSQQQHQTQQQHPQSGQQMVNIQHQHHLQSNSQINLGNNEDDLVTFQQALAQPAIKGVRTNQTRRPCSNTQGFLNSRPIDAKTEEERLFELNQFLSEEYHRHVGSRKRSNAGHGGSPIKRLRE